MGQTLVLKNKIPKNHNFIFTFTGKLFLKIIFASVKQAHLKKKRVRD